MEDLNTRLNKISNTSNYIYKPNIVNSILKEFKAQFSKKIGFDKAVEIDRKHHGVYVKYSKILDIIDEELNDDKNYLKYTSSKIIDGYGNIAVMYNGDPYVTLRLAIKALKTHNNIVFFAKKYLAINTKIIETINILAQKMKYAKRILSIEYNISEGTIFYNQNFFNMLLFVGEKREYQNFKKKLGIPSIYSGYGYVDVFIDSKKFKNEILNMDEYANENYVHINYYYESDYSSVSKFLNKYELTETFILFSEDSDIIYKYINGIKAKNIFINKSPFENYKFDITEKDLVSIINKVFL